MPSFRVLSTDIPNLPGVPAQVTVTLAEAMLVIQCPPEDVDPPGYERLRRLAAERMVDDLESKLASLEDTRARLESQLEELRFIADPLGEQKRQLGKVPGLGPKRCQALLDHFGSIEAIRQASVEELAAVKGMNKGAAKAIKKAMKEG